MKPFLTVRQLLNSSFQISHKVILWKLTLHAASSLHAELFSIAVRRIGTRSTFLTGRRYGTPVSQSENKQEKINKILMDVLIGSSTLYLICLCTLQQVLLNSNFINTHSFLITMHFCKLQSILILSLDCNYRCPIDKQFLQAQKHLIR